MSTTHCDLTNNWTRPEVQGENLIPEPYSKEDESCGTQNTLGSVVRRHRTRVRPVAFRAGDTVFRSPPSTRVQPRLESYPVLPTVSSSSWSCTRGPLTEVRLVFFSYRKCQFRGGTKKFLPRHKGWCGPLQTSLTSLSRTTYYLPGPLSKYNSSHY